MCIGYNPSSSEVLIVILPVLLCIELLCIVCSIVKIIIPWRISMQLVTLLLNVTLFLTKITYHGAPVVVDVGIIIA